MNMLYYTIILSTTYHKTMLLFKLTVFDNLLLILNEVHEKTGTLHFKTKAAGKSSNSIN